MAIGQVQKFDPLPAYREHLQHLIDFDTIRRARLRVAMDAMYGTGRGYIRNLLTEAGAEVHEIRGEMNPGFNGIHPEPIAKHLKPLMELVQTDGFHLGLADRRRCRPHRRRRSDRPLHRPALHHDAGAALPGG